MFTNQSNLLLSALSADTYQRLLLHANEISLTVGQILHQPNTPITEIYFPLETAISLIMVLQDNSIAEVCTVGYQGMIGLSAILGKQPSPYQATVQIPGKAIVIPETALQAEFERGEDLSQVLLLYAQARIKQISQISACQTHHLIEQRLARWLLIVRKATGKESLPVTQKVISQMLGVRRASITEAAISLQNSGAISYSRGRIQILQPQLLEDICCECYQEFQKSYNPLLALKST